RPRVPAMGRLAVPLLPRGEQGVTALLYGMLDPAIDDEHPEFCYFGNPTEVIGAMFAPLAAEVTPEGFIATGFGELMLFVGNPPRPARRRVRTLVDGRLPLVEFEFVDDGVRYGCCLFASEVPGTP